MDIIRTPEELLYSLARNGDPIAYHTLFAERIAECYRHLLRNGRSAETATEELTAFARDTYKEFCNLPSPQPAQDWFATKLSKRFGINEVDSDSDDQSRHAADEIAPPHDIVRLGILRAHSERIRAGGRTTKHPRRIHRRPSAKKKALLLLALGVVCTGGVYIWIAATGNPLSESISDAPLHLQRVLFRSRAEQSPPAQPIPQQSVAVGTSDTAETRKTPPGTASEAPPSPPASSRDALVGSSRRPLPQLRTAVPARESPPTTESSSAHTPRTEQNLAAGPSAQTSQPSPQIEIASDSYDAGEAVVPEARPDEIDTHSSAEGGPADNETMPSTPEQSDLP